MCDLMGFHDLVEEMNVVRKVLAQLEDEGTNAIQCGLTQNTITASHNAGKRVDHEGCKVRNIDLSRQSRQAIDGRLADILRILRSIKQTNNRRNDEMHVLLST